MAAAPRSGLERKRHALELLGAEEDVWVATADVQGGVCQVPLSFVWDGAVLVLSTPVKSPTGRNLAGNGRVRIGLGGTRDVVLIEGTAVAYPAAEVPQGYADAFAAKLVWDPREEANGDYGYYVVTPVRVQAWREANELKGRTLMREGAWLY